LPAVARDAKVAQEDAMAENKLQPTDQPVDAFIASVPDETRRADARTLVEMMERLSGYPAVVWGYGIVGFGEYRYRYDSGREGRAGRIGFAPRAKELVVYMNDGYAKRGEQLARLGKHRIGKSCLYIKKLADVDRAVLEEMMRDSLAYMRDKYPEGA
jgi:hypothetical protein